MPLFHKPKDDKMNFKKIEGPFGMPVYLEHIPEVRSISMGWTMFVGSGDDESVGLPGLYHWFEHLPFRGTVKYPGGYKETKGRISSFGGHVGAYTSMHATTFHAHVPMSIWQEALSTITDLMAQPILSDKAVHAERDIVCQEILKKKASLKGLVSYELPEILWKGHPFGHPVLGTEGSLTSMTPDIVRAAQKANYDRSRCALIVSGNVTEKELLSELQIVAPLIPSRGLSPRSTAAMHGQLPPWRDGAVSIRETKHASSIVCMLFPLIEHETLSRKFEWRMVEHMFDFGSTDAPLLRILREEKKLVYSAELMICEVPGGGYWGFCAETQIKNIEAVIASLKDLLKDPEVTSAERLALVKRGLCGSFDIRPVDPAKHRGYAEHRLVHGGVVYSDDEYLDYMDSVTIGDIRRHIEQIDPASAHIIVFRGESNVSLI
jgi:predicted Zn-dependent peptidase